jgi:hypothetical protein
MIQILERKKVVEWIFRIIFNDVGVWKSDRIPEHKIPELTHESKNERGDKESLNVCTRLKSCESLYTCPRAPFYRETKGLLHSEITLRSREYS